MKNKGCFVVTVCCLVFCTGYIAGKHIEPIDVFQWTPELKFGDLIASLIALITFIFAYKGFEDNRKQYFSSIKPIIAQHHYHPERDALIYIWAIHNYGNGIATKINYAIHFKEEEISLLELATLIKNSCNKEKEVIVKISYEDLLGNTYAESFPYVE